MVKICRETLRLSVYQFFPTIEHANWERDAINNFVVHQVGKKPFDALKRMCRVNPDNIPKTYDWLGNVTTATLPINFDLLKKSGKVHSMDKTCLLGTGSGIVLSWFCIVN